MMYSLALVYNANLWDATMSYAMFWWQGVMVCYSSAWLGPTYLESSRRERLRKNLKLVVNADPPYSGMTRKSCAPLHVVR
jgi:hypothetical protein